MILTVTKIWNDPQKYAHSYKIVYSDEKEWFAPNDPSNRHYQEILEWVADGNTIAEPE